MAKQGEEKKSNGHDSLVDWYSNKYYSGSSKDQIREKLLSDSSLFDRALEDIHKDKYADLSYDDFKTKYTSLYGNPFPEKKNPIQNSGIVSSTGGQDQFSNEIKALEREFTPIASESTSINPDDQFKSKMQADPQFAMEQDEKSNKVDQEQLEIDREVKENDNGVGRANSFLGTINESVYGLPADVMETIAIGGNQVGRLAEWAGIAERGTVEENALYKTAQNYRQWLDEIFPTNPAYKEDLDTQVASAIGDLTKLIGSGGFSRGSAIASELNNFNKAGNLITTTARQGKQIIGSPPALVGAMETGLNEFKLAKASGATDDEAFQAFLKNATVGSVLEAIPIMQFFNRLDKTSGGGVKQALKNGVVQGVEEMTTEVTQQIYSNINAADTYDATRKWYDGLTESGGIGFGLGFFLGGASTTLRKKQAEAKTPEEKAEIQKGIDFLDQKSEELRQTEIKKDEIIKQYDQANTPEGRIKSLNEEIDTVLKKETVTNKDINDIAALEDKISIVNEEVNQEVDKKTDGISKKIETLRRERDVLYSNATSETEIQKASKKESEINKELLGLLKERQKVRLGILNTANETNQSGLGGEINQGTDPGAQQETNITQPEVSAGVGVDSQADQGIIDVTGQNEVIPQNIQTGTQATENTANIEMPANPELEVVDDASQGEDVALLKSSEDTQGLIDSVPEIEEGQKITHGDYKIEKFDYGNGAPQIRISKKSDPNLIAVYPSKYSTKEALTQFIAKETSDISKGETGDVLAQEVPESEQVVNPPVPDSDLSDGKKERSFPKQIKNAEDIAPEVKENLTEKTTHYTPVSNVQTVEEANEYLKNADPEQTLNELRSKDTNIPPRVRVALAQGVIKKANKSFKEATTQQEKDRNLKVAVETAEVVGEYLTELGQGVQAASLFSRLTPEGQVMRITNRIKKERDTRLKKTAPALKNKKETIDRINKEAVESVLKEEKIEKVIKAKVEKGKTKAKAIKNAVDFLEKLKIDMKGKAFDATFALPASMWNTAISTIQGSLKLGLKISQAIDAAVKKVKETHKGDWDEAGFRNFAEDNLKQFEAALDPDRAVKRGLKDLGTSVKDVIRKHYTEVDTIKRSLTQKLINDAGLDAVDAQEISDQINEAFNRITSKAKEKALQSEMTVRDRIDPKYSREIDKRLIELSNLGAMSQEDFNKVYSQKLGIKELSKEDVSKIIEHTEKIQEADLFAEEAEKNFTDENIKKHIQLQKEKLKAQNGIADILADKLPKDVWSTLSTILQGNLLSPISIVTNVYSNLNLMPLRLLSRAAAQAMDTIYTGVTKKPRKIDILASMKGYNTGFGNGIIAGKNDLFEGASVHELDKKDINRNLKPLKALMDGIDKTKPQLLEERINNLIEGTMGWPAEAMFRLLSFGDQPFQKAAEYAKAFELAKLKGLEGKELEKFILFPDPESAELIQKAGEDATFKQTGGTADLINKGFDQIFRHIGKIPVVGGPFRFLAKTQFPYVKTPINIILETMDYALPPVSFARSIYYAKEGNRVKSFEYMGKAITGAIIMAVAKELFKAGLLSPDPEKDPKQRAMQNAAFPANGLNISAFNRMMAGEDASIKKDDTWINYEKMGLIGVLFTIVANSETKKSKEEKKFDNLFSEMMYDTYSSAPNAASSALEMSFLQGANTLLDAIKSQEWDQWLSNTFNATTSVALPNTLSALNRTTRTNLPELRDPELSTRLLNVLKSKVFLADSLPSKIDLWGEKIKQTPEGRNAALYHLFDVTKAREISADPLSFEVYKVWKESMNNEAIPPIPSQKFIWEGEGAKLTPDLYEKLQIEVGKERTAEVKALLMSDYWTQLSSAEKVEELKAAYESGFDNGKSLFMEKYGDKVLPLFKKTK